MKNINIKDTKTGYKGTVKVEILDDKKPRTVVKHNNGTIDLFEFLGKALMGENTAPIRPNGLMAVDDKGNWLFSEPIPMSRFYGNSIDGDSPKYTVSFEFFVSGSTVISTNMINKLQLGYNNLTTFTTYASINLADVTAVAGQNMKVTWQLSITNEATKEE